MKLRYDKFIWSVRLSKTRALAAEAIAKGKTKVNGQQIKPSREVNVGDFIQLYRNTAVYTYHVIALIDRRIGATLVNNYLSDMTKPEELEKEKAYLHAQKDFRLLSDGKPSKKDRRAIEGFLSKDLE